MITAGLSGEYVDLFLSDTAKSRRQETRERERETPKDER